MTYKTAARGHGPHVACTTPGAGRSPRPLRHTKQVTKLDARRAERHNRQIAQAVAQALYDLTNAGVTA